MTDPEPALPAITQLEAQDLVAAVLSGFGACECGQPKLIGGAWVVVQTCAGHAWLNEPHRLERLLWIRRTLPQWADKEHATTRAEALQRALEQQLAEITDGLA